MIEANRRNAQFSTGPKTPRGKATVARNAITHGILAREVVIRGGGGEESQKDFQFLGERLSEHYGPVDIVEESLVQIIARCLWRKARAIRAENGEIRRRLAALSAYPTTEYSEAETLKRDAEASSFSLPPADKTDKVLRYEAHLDKQLYRAMDQLERLQRQRKGEAIPPPLNINLGVRRV